MDFGNAGMALSTLSSYDAASVSSSSMAYAVGTAVLVQSLDMTEVLGDSMLKMMEQSVTPELGGSIDVYV